MRCRILAWILVVAVSGVSQAADWTRFRGPDGSGRIDGPAIPTSWSATTNVKWKTPLPGKGSSSPVVTNDRIYVTCYTGYGIDAENPGDPKDLVRHLIAFDRSNGSELWRKSIATTSVEDPYEGFITQHGYASSTPVVDGDNVYALLGKSGLFAFDKNGNEIWRHDLGQLSDPAKWGDGTSPIVVGDLIIVDAGVLGNQFVGIDKATGKKLWSVENKAFTNNWATPTPVTVGETTEVLFSVPKFIYAYDPKTGKELWSAKSPLDDATCASIVTSDGVAYLMGSRVGNAIAVKCGGTGDVSATNTVWKKKIRSGIATPIIVGGNMYWCTSGIFYAAALATGDIVYQERLPRLGGQTGGFPNADYSSPIAVGDQIIQFTRNGESYVIKAGNQFELVSHNPAFEGDSTAFSSTPAVSDGSLFVRSDGFLYCIGTSL